MNITNTEQFKNYLRSHGFKPKDYLGQNFLVDDEVLAQIIKAADLKKTDTVLEVGPGLGVLTRELVKTSKEVWAIEKDKRLVNILKTEFAGNEKLKIINEDILRFHIQKNIQSEYKVVANIPYYLTSKLFQYFLEQKNPPELMVLMVQKEVGERVVAKPGELSILGISVQVYANAEIVVQVPKTSFWPVPKVDSVILKIVPKEKYPEIEDKKLFFSIVKRAFAGKRKQIHNTIKNPEALERAEIDPKLRPQDISLEKWISLYKVTADSLELIGNTKL